MRDQLTQSFVKDVPITVPIPISNIVRVPIGQFAISTLLTLNILAPIKAPASGAAGIPVLGLKLQKSHLQLDNKIDLCLA